MRICFTFNGRTFCFYLPIYRWQFQIPIPDPGPEFKDHEGLILDATVLGSMHAAASQLSDARAREALVVGLGNALEIVQKKAGGIAKLSFQRED